MSSIVMIVVIAAVVYVVFVLGLALFCSTNTVSEESLAAHPSTWSGPTPDMRSAERPASSDPPDFEPFAD